jgi:predicted short-subunit dehydrogenase-like oxidoreductase (DUF2520 family)
MKTLNIIGCGAVGAVLGRLFHEARLFRIGDILNRSLASGAAAAAFIGAGRAVSGYAELSAADVYLIAANDGAITACAEALAATGLVGEGAMACHLSGALPSTALGPIKDRGAAVASVHPVKSFADPAASAAGFAGTWCGIEGDAAAVAVLSEAFEAIGGKIFAVSSDFKTIYHAGAVLVCNYLTSLMEVGLRAYEKAGLPRETALLVIEPLVRGTLDNIFRSGPEQALTGPIARGDVAVVSAQLDAIDGWDGEIASIYRVLGRVALSLSRQRAEHGKIPELAALERLLAEAAT